MAIDRMSTEEALARLKEQGAGRGLFDALPLSGPGEGSLAAIMVDEVPESAAQPAAGPPRAFIALVAVCVPVMLALGGSMLYAPTAGGSSAASQGAPAPREHVHAGVTMARRGLYVDLDLEDLEFYDERASASTGGPRAPSDGAAPATPGAARATGARARPSNGLAGLADLAGLGVGFAPQPVLSAGQTSAARREASFLDLTRQVRRRCRGEADSAPSSVLLRAHVVIGKNGGASEVKVEGNSNAVGACVEREIRSYKFPDEAALGTVDVPFSWRKQ